MRPYGSLALLAFGEIADTVTTNLGATHGLMEANPLAYMIGVPAFFGMKFLVVVLLLGIVMFYPAHFRIQNVIRWVAVFAAGGLIAIATLNLFLVVR